MSLLHLLGTLIDLVQEALKHLALHARRRLINLANQSGDALVALLLVLGETLRDRNGCLGEEGLDASFRFGVLDTVVFLIVSDATLTDVHLESCAARGWHT